MSSHASPLNHSDDDCAYPGWYCIITFDRSRFAAPRAIPAASSRHSTGPAGTSSPPKSPPSVQITLADWYRAPKYRPNVYAVVGVNTPRDAHRESSGTSDTYIPSAFALLIT